MEKKVCPSLRRSLCQGSFEMVQEKFECDCERFCHHPRRTRSEEMLVLVYSQLSLWVIKYVSFCLKFKNNKKKKLLYDFTFLIFSRWKNLTVKERNKTKERLCQEVCHICAEVCLQRGYRHYCLIKGVTQRELASLLEDCTFCNESFDCTEQMFSHCITVHLGILAWVSPFVYGHFTIGTLITDTQYGSTVSQLLSKTESERNLDQ